MVSIWQKNSEAKGFSELGGDIKTEVLIVGGGIAGLFCANFLQNAGVDCVLVEADRICRGVTANTTAKITLQHGLIYSKIMDKYGIDFAKMYLKAQREALKFYEETCQKIDCDYTRSQATVYSTKNRLEIEKELKAYETLGLKAKFSEKIDLPLKIKGALTLENQAEFNPLKFCYSLAENLKIYENTKVIEITNKGAITNKGKINAQKIIIATHFPFLNKYGGYFLKMYQHRSYVLVLKNAVRLTGMYVDSDLKGLSFRGYKDLLLLGGGSHRTGKKGGNWEELSEFSRLNFSDAKELTRFATQDCMTLDEIPYIGEYSKKTPNLYVATGFNKWGMTNSAVAAKILCDAITTKENEYAEVFSPKRTILHKQFMINMGETLVNFMTPTIPRCPHLGCALKYNKQEHSWDCACHGSRFTEEGKLVENPATDDIDI